MKIQFQFNLFDIIHTHTKQIIKKIRKSQNEHHSELIKTIYTTLFNTQMSVKYLFYDKDNDKKPSIFNDPEYNETFKQFYLH